MNLLDALVRAVTRTPPIGVHDEDGNIARTVIFVFTDDNQSSFVSEVELEELVPLMEQWCAEQRVEMGMIQ